MISPLILCFILQVLLHIINTVGKQTINDTLWLLYTTLTTTATPQTESLPHLRREVLRLHREMTATSAQDAFAKWAKLRRQHDKAKEKYDTLSRSQQSTRTNFDRIVTALRWLSTQGLNFLTNFWFSKQPMFWVPRGWVPYPVEWVLSFPRAPVGSVSVNIWGIACATAVGLVAEGVVGVWSLRSGRVESGPRKGEKISMEAVGGGGVEKKEL